MARDSFFYGNNFKFVPVYAFGKNAHGFSGLCENIMFKDTDVSI